MGSFGLRSRRMAHYRLPEWPVFNRSRVAGFQRSLTSKKFYPPVALNITSSVPHMPFEPNKEVGEAESGRLVAHPSG